MVRVNSLSVSYSTTSGTALTGQTYYGYGWDQSTSTLSGAASYTTAGVSSVTLGFTDGTSFTGVLSAVNTLISPSSLAFSSDDATRLDAGASSGLLTLHANSWRPNIINSTATCSGTPANAFTSSRTVYANLFPQALDVKAGYLTGLTFPAFTSTYTVPIFCNGGASVKQCKVALFVDTAYFSHTSLVSGSTTSFNFFSKTKSVATNANAGGTPDPQGDVASSSTFFYVDGYTGVAGNNYLTVAWTGTSSVAGAVYLGDWTLFAAAGAPITARVAPVVHAQCIQMQNGLLTTIVGPYDYAQTPRMTVSGLANMQVNCGAGYCSTGVTIPTSTGVAPASYALCKLAQAPITCPLLGNLMTGSTTGSASSSADDVNAISAAYSAWAYPGAGTATQLNTNNSYAKFYVPTLSFMNTFFGG